MSAEVAKRKIVVRKLDGKFASETVCKRVGDKHGTSSDRGYIDNKKIKNHGELMSHNRTIYVHKCEICQNTFEGVATAKFCSNACRQKAKRAKADVKKSAAEETKTYKQTDAFESLKNTNKIAAQYAHPSNPTLTWTGRGVMPVWLKTMLDSDAKLEDFKI